MCGMQRTRPRRLYGTTHRVRTPLGTAFVTINCDETGAPFEVFANVGKAGSDIAAVSEAIGRLISLVLRIPSSMSPAERLEAVYEQLNGIGGSRHFGLGADRVTSLPDGLATALRRETQRDEDDAGAATGKPAQTTKTDPGGFPTRTCVPTAATPAW